MQSQSSLWGSSGSCYERLLLPPRLLFLKFLFNSVKRVAKQNVSFQCLRTLVGHTGGVWSSQMRDNIIISGSTDRTLKVWNAETGECIHTLYGHTSTVRCMHLHEKR